MGVETKMKVEMMTITMVRVIVVMLMRRVMVMVTNITRPVMMLTIVHDRIDLR